jgi:hypothetical protein
MPLQHIRGYIIGSCAALVLSGCVSQATTTATGPQDAMPSLTGRATGSWMESKASSQDLLYVAASPNGQNGNAYVYTYPQGHLVGTLTGFATPRGECADSAGDVFVVAYSNGSMSSSTIYEYGHGGTNPIATLSDPDVAVGCAVDPTTDNLAASGNGVAIFKNASGNPTMYHSSEYSFYYCSYDDKGNLYVMAINGRYADQQVLVRLASGSSNFEQISLSPKLYMAENISPTVQWDGKHIAVTSEQSRGPISLYRLRIAGNKAVVISSATLSSLKNNFSGGMWIQGKSIIGVGHGKRAYWDAFLWPSPKGGLPDRTIRRVGETRYPAVSAVTVSVGQPR